MTAPVAQAPVAPNPARPGYTTTEFWTSTVAPTLFLILNQLNVGTGSPKVQADAKLGSYILAALGYSFYAISRGHMKKGAVIAGALNQLVAKAPDIANNLRTVVPPAVYKELAPALATIQAVDPQFSEEQLQDLSEIVGNIIKNHGVSKADLGPLLTQAIETAVKNVNSNANSPAPLLSAAQDVQQVEDVIKGAAATTQVDGPPNDGATFVAPSF